MKKAVTNIVERVGNLITVKTIITMLLSIVFAMLSLKEKISPEVFMTVFTTVIAFYFGTQKIDDTGSKKENIDSIDDNEAKG